MITFKQKGDFKKTKIYLEHAREADYKAILEHYGRLGVAALAYNTPVDTGNTANSWNYEIQIKRGAMSISWTNSNIQNGVPIAILLQYGHGTKNGGYVEGVDYINPALQPIFDKLVDAAWKEITSR